MQLRSSAGRQGYRDSLSLSRGISNASLLRPTFRLRRSLGLQAKKSKQNASRKQGKKSPGSRGSGSKQKSQPAPTAKDAVQTPAPAQGGQSKSSSSSSSNTGIAPMQADDAPQQAMLASTSGSTLQATASQDSFESRLSKLQASSDRLQQEAADEASQEAPLASQDAYSKPPSLFDTLRNSQDGGSDDKVNPFGSGALGLVAVGVIVVALIASVIGLDSFSTNEASQPQLTEQDQSSMRSALQGFEATLKDKPEDTEALEGAAVAAAELGSFGRAEELLTRLVGVNSRDPQAWRLLAEVRSKLGERPSAVAAYREAYKLAEADIGVLKGFAEALVANARQAEAVRIVEGAKDIAAKAVEQRGPDGATNDGAAITPIEVDLLLAKVYSQWRGHTSDAFSVYDRAISENPQDFRGYLAKGVLLRKEGRKGDADRAFLQARYLAPKSMRSVVDRIASPQT